MYTAQSSCIFKDSIRFTRFSGGLQKNKKKQEKEEKEAYLQLNMATKLLVWNYSGRLESTMSEYVALHGRKRRFFIDDKCPLNID